MSSSSFNNLVTNQSLDARLRESELKNEGNYSPLIDSSSPASAI
jgi:hypothetical protein